MVSIDLGSNTFRCIAMDCLTGEWGEAFERIVKTADGLHDSGRINDAAVERIIDAIEESRPLFDYANVPVIAVTTAAMRMASNANEALERIRKATGIDFHVIGEEKEAYYALLAVTGRLAALGMDPGRFVLVDIGGGSTEVIFYEAGNHHSRSFPLGIVTLAQACDSYTAIETVLRQELTPIRDYVEEHFKKFGKPDTYVSTAGTPTTIAAFTLGMTYASYDAVKVNGFRLTPHTCETALDELLAMPDDERARYVGVGRESLIIAGIIIVREFFRLLGFSDSVVIDDGVREGVAIDFCERNGPL